MCGRLTLATNGSERRVDPLELRASRQAGERAGEVLLPRPGKDVLKTVGLQDPLLHDVKLGRAQVTTTSASKVVAIGRSLAPQDRVDRRDQCDQLVDRSIPGLRRDAGVQAPPLQLIEDRVLGLFLPVEEKDVLKSSDKSASSRMLSR